jgi:hypothetical protein
MAGHDLRQRVEVRDDDRTVATAEVTTSQGSGGTARVSLRAEPGHITPGRRASLIDAVLDLLGVQGSALVEAAFRLGDSESLHRLQERCEDVSTRPAGWARSSMRTIRPAAPGSTSQTQPASNPCRPHNDVRGDHPVRQPRRRPGQHETGQLIEQYRRASCGPAPASSGGCLCRRRTGRSAPGRPGARRGRPLLGGRQPMGTRPGAQGPSLNRYRRLCGTSTCWRASKSSTYLPAPSTTDSSGFSARWIGSPVSSRSRSSRPCNNPDRPSPVCG